MLPEKYEELGIIGKGGQGIVYKVKKKSNGGIYALKTIDLSKIKSSKQKRKIDAEIKLLQDIEHPGIVEVRSIDRNDNILYIEMDYIKGPTLKRAISEGFSDYKRGVNIMLGVLNPMIYLHSQHVAHLDIKPQNIILDGNNKPTLVDFGSSFLMHGNKELHTMTDNREGTAGYVAPEILMKEESKFDPKLADIYSLGATLYTVLTQQTIYNVSDSQSHAFALGRREQIIPPHELNKKIDEGISQICMQALAYNPKDRIQSVKKFYNDLELALNKKSSPGYELLFTLKKIIVGSSLISIIFGSYLFLADYMGKDPYTFQSYFNIALKYEQGLVPEEINYKKSLEYYKKAANSGNSDALIKIGNLYIKGGYGIEKNLVESLKWYQMALDKGNTEVYSEIGYLFRSVGGNKRNYAKALEYYKKAWEVGDKHVAEDIGELYRIGGYGVEKDFKQSLKWYQIALDEGNTGVYDKIGHLFRFAEEEKRNYAEALEYYKKAWEAGDKHVADDIAELYRIGGYGIIGEEGGEFDYLVALEWYQKAINEGNREVYDEIGHLYWMGIRGEKNYTKALEYYKKAWDTGDTSVAQYIGEVYRIGGHGVEYNFKESLKWFQIALKIDSTGIYDDIGYLYRKEKKYKKALEYYKKAWNTGDMFAARSIGYIYFLGRNGVKKNRYEALNWYNKIPEEDWSAVTFFIVGAIYHSGGDGVNQDLTKALKYYIKASKKGHKLSKSKIEEVKRIMNKMDNKVK